MLGSHEVLEVDVSLAKRKTNLRSRVYPLGIGGKGDPARLGIQCSAVGQRWNASLIDMGNRFRLIVNEVEAVEAIHPLPNLPVARVLWKALPDMQTGCTAWLLAGGAHHTCYSQNLSADILQDFADMAGIECVQIGRDTRLRELKNELRWNEMAYR